MINLLSAILTGFLVFSAFICQATHLYDSKFWIYTNIMTLEFFLTLLSFFNYLYKLWKLQGIVLKIKWI